MTHTVALYARISVALEESVSLARQLEAGRKYAEARGWEIVAEFIDDGVSATHNAPEKRAGWRALLESPQHFDAVIVWKIDRLARRINDFHDAYRTLERAGRSLVLIEDNLDLTTTVGQIVVGVLAGFAQLEAEAISARVAGARQHLISQGRVVGGTVPYGWRSIDNPGGPGMVLVQDAEKIEWVRGMAERVLMGDTIYSVMKWLDAEGAPLPTSSQKNRKRKGWHYSTVERILRHPLLAGMTPFNPGNADRKRGSDVLRDANGMPIIDPRLAVVTSDDRRKLLRLLDDRESAQARPRASKGTTSVFLSRIVTCGHCDELMHRGTTQGRPSLSCSKCHQVISRNQLDPHIIGRLLDERGEWRTYESRDITEDNRAALADIEAAINDVTVKFASDAADVPKLIDQLEALKAMRTEARRAQPAQRRWIIKSRLVHMDWADASSDEERRNVLAGQVQSIIVTRGKTGRQLDPNRVCIVWREDPYDEESDLADQQARWG